MATPDHIVFIGDSITDCGRRDAFAPFGNGYMHVVRSFITARHPHVAVRWTNRGVGGDTIRDLSARWEDDVIALGPSVLSVLIGINDVWRAFGDSREDAVPLDEYTTTYRRLLDDARAETGCQLIVGTPFMIEPDLADPMRAAMEHYREAATSIARDYDARLVDIQAAFDRVLMHTAPDAWSHDRVHPNAPGHAVIADPYITALEELLMTPT